MDYFDDFQIEEGFGFDFTEADLDCFFNEDDDTKSFNTFLNSNCDF